MSETKSTFMTRIDSPVLEIEDGRSVPPPNGLN